MANRVELDENILDKVAGGAFGFDPDGNGTYTMFCQFSGNVYYGITLNQIIEMAKVGATVENNAEGEATVLAWAHEQGIL